MSKAKQSKKAKVSSAAAQQLANYNAIAQQCANNAQRTAQPRIIAYIMQQLIAAKQNNKAVTVAQLLAACVKQFPERTATGMLVTVRAQLSRLPHERGFEIAKQRVGRVVTYSAK